MKEFGGKDECKFKLCDNSLGEEGQCTWGKLGVPRHKYWWHHWGLNPLVVVRVDAHLGGLHWTRDKQFG